MQRLIRIFSVCLLAVLAGCSPAPETHTEDTEDVALFGGLTASDKLSSPLAQVTKGVRLHFPADHQAHPDFAIEWWYFTANLVDADNPKRHYSLQYTLFRFNTGDAVSNAWSDGQIFMAHAALHNAEQHWFEERFARAGAAGVFQQPFSIRLDDWLWRAEGDSLLPAELNLAWADVSVNLTLSSHGPLVLHGEKGYSEKSANGSHASYYYSQPFIQVSGTAQIAGEPVSLSGQGWYDHEWTSQLLDENTLGWDWFSIHLEDGRKLMAFRMQLRNQLDHVTGTLVSAEGETRTLAPSSITLTPTTYSEGPSSNRYPSEWRIHIPEHGIDISTQPMKDDQWNRGRFSYYEGAIRVSGTHNGVGFMELTGY
ncbi:lipocalin-like domain-containing protein [Alteromonas oceanisediminis]|uniref:lipocalin-like domain-containing protein n=1 Tax=Alteromonas oceanisediminis TaxID=2836180 RepID=UPI001BDA61EA|nr:lipocalin-like domain-containing protein [Alteromonas oceanisediminis]MBT0585703.1 carotenoid 1,2-hydratase [Alteromonas oceanisediminis]